MKGVLGSSRLGSFVLARASDAQEVFITVEQTVTVVSLANVGKTFLLSDLINVTQNVVAHNSSNRQAASSVLSVGSQATLNRITPRRLTNQVFVSQNVQFRNTTVRISVSNNVNVTPLVEVRNTNRRISLLQTVAVDQVARSQFVYVQATNEVLVTQQVINRNPRRIELQNNVVVGQTAAYRTQFVNVSISNNVLVEQNLRANFNPIFLTTNVAVTPQVALRTNPVRQNLQSNVKVNSIVNGRSNIVRISVANYAYLVQLERHGRNAIEIFVQALNQVLVTDFVKSNFVFQNVSNQVIVNPEIRAQGIKYVFGIASPNMLSHGGASRINPIRYNKTEQVVVQQTARANQVYQFLVQGVKIGQNVRFGQKNFQSTQNVILVEHIVTPKNSRPIINVQTSINVTQNIKFRPNRQFVTTPVNVNNTAIGKKDAYRSVTNNVLVSSLEDHLRVAYIRINETLTPAETLSFKGNFHKSLQAQIAIQQAMSLVGTQRTIKVTENLEVRERHQEFKLMRNIRIQSPKTGEFILPSAEFGDQIGQEQRVTLHRSMSNVTYTTATTSNRIRTNYTVKTWYKNATAFMDVIKANLGVELVLENWHGERYQGYFVTFPHNQVSESRDKNRTELVSFNIVFEGIKL